MSQMSFLHAEVDRRSSSSHGENGAVFSPLNDHLRASSRDWSVVRMTDNAKGAPYKGSRLELVIAIDIGTTFSGVTYAFLRPGEIPKIVSVTEFSNQTHHQAKVPTVLCYDWRGKLLGVGPETTDDFLQDAISDDATEWMKIKYVKMRFRPEGMKIALKLDDLPPNKSAEYVMADFMRYLHKETIKFIVEHHTDGELIWNQVKNRVQFVLSQPNGWKGLPQQRYRKCAVLAGLVPNDEEARQRIKFVSEGEASALSCLAGKFAPSLLPSHYKFIVLDAGGGTLDVSSYRVVRRSPLELEEIAIPDSRFAGSIYVNEQARRVFEARLLDSKFDDGEIINGLLQEFESRVKPNFDNPDRNYSIKIPRVKESVKELGIVNGCLKLPGKIIEDCFRFSVENAVKSVQAIREQFKDDGKDMPVWLVGGFGASPWLYRQLTEQLRSKGFVVRKPDSNQAKAVADGAVRFHIYKNVTVRLSPTCFGTTCGTRYDPHDKSHSKRRHLVYDTWLLGTQIGPIFSCIMKKSERVAASRNVSAAEYLHEIKDIAEAQISCSIYAFDGEVSNLPYWFSEHKSKFRTICNIQADLSEQCTRQSRIYVGGVRLWLLSYSVELTLGSTEIEARIKWEHNVREDKVFSGDSGLYLNSSTTKTTNGKMIRKQDLGKGDIQVTTP